RPQRRDITNGDRLKNADNCRRALTPATRIEDCQDLCRRKGAVEEADFVQPTKEAPACQNSGRPVAEIQIESGLRFEGTQVLLGNDCPVQINDSEAGCLVISKGDVLPRICDNEPG